MLRIVAKKVEALIVWGRMPAKMKKLENLVFSSFFEKLILMIIGVNSITLGFETVPLIVARLGSVLTYVDLFCLYFFTLELSLKFYFKRMSYFKDPWAIFDLVVVAIAWVPAAGVFSVLRSLRVLRALRLISTIPRLRGVVSGLLGSLPGLGAVSAIMLLLFYVGAVVATKLFGATFPHWFGSLGASSYSLFQIMTLESWSMGIVRPVMEEFPRAWMFFVPFILVTTFTTLNLLIAVLVNAMQAETETAAQERDREGHLEREKMLEELRDIKAQLKELLSK